MMFTAASAGQEIPRIGLAGVLVVAVNGLGRVYTPRVLPSSLDRGFWLAGSGFVAALAAFWEAASLAVVALSAVLFTFLAVCCRSIIYYALRRARRRGRAAPALVISACAHGRELATNLLSYPEYGLLPLGFLDEADDEQLFLPVLGRVEDVAHVVQSHGVRAVVITGQGQQSVARTARALGCEVFLAPNLGEVIVDFVTLREHVRSFPLLRMRPEAQSRISWPLKRALDISVALTGLVLTAPILAICAMLIRHEVGSGALFRQRRVGYLGESIEVIKIRTLKPADAHESATLWSIAHDSRVGPVGKLLRKTSLDELPQFWNVLRGGMSIVGPRPERPHFVKKFSRTIPGYALRHRMPIGITGWAQIHGLRGDTSIEDRARFDNHYIDDWTLRTDLKIMLRTLGALLRLGGR
ncbi:sugar transferase [Nonomuraea sp. NPDC046802]|uniref:sugar transferase n=1 Tax=Nonomuraea sp. NPDC046802 TaxID=3154919 RepID=UPI0033F75A20